MYTREYMFAARIAYVSVMLLATDLPEIFGFNFDQDHFAKQSAFQNKICPLSERVIEDTTKSAVQCILLCSDLDDQKCKVASFIESTSTCYGCITNDETTMTDVADALSYIRYSTRHYIHLVSGLGGIPDNQLSASSTYSDPLSHGPERSRRNTMRTDSGIGGWQADILNNPTPYIQADFGGSRYVVGVATQGRCLDWYYQWVKSYKTSYSIDCLTFVMVKSKDGIEMEFSGNNDSETIVTNFLDIPVYARCVRVNPTSWQNFVALRFDILGL